jgi:hypothetical protein
MKKEIVAALLLFLLLLPMFAGIRRVKTMSRRPRDEETTKD